MVPAGKLEIEKRTPPYFASPMRGSRPGPGALDPVPGNVGRGACTSGEVQPGSGVLELGAEEATGAEHLPKSEPHPISHPPEGEATRASPGPGAG